MYPYIHIFRFSMVDFGVWVDHDETFWMLEISLGHFSVALGYTIEKVNLFSYDDVSSIL